MPGTVEPAFNYALAEALRGKHPRWGEAIGGERTGVLWRDAGKRPDIVIPHPGGIPIIVETEYAPAATVERDARRRVGAVLGATGEPVEQTIAVVVPPDLAQAPQGRLASLIAEAEFRYCRLSGETPETAARWPERGWLSGGIDELAGFIEQNAVSERRIREGVRTLEEGVRQAAGRLRAELAPRHPDALEAIAAALHQEDGEQTSRMAMAIVANALTFHTAIASAYGVPSIDELLALDGAPDKGRVLDAWDHVMREVNYWPIFSTAAKILLPLPDRTARAALERLARVARDLDGLGVTTVHDLAGQMFGELIADRKFLATFYTRPASAALLAELAVARLDVDWGNPDAVKALRIADLACGTGALLSAAYRAVASRHRRAGGDDEAIHREMLERALIGADIMPAATHLTASMLSSAHPTMTFARTRIHTMPYGDQRDENDETRGVYIGSLDLIASDEQPSLFGTGEHVLHGRGEVAVNAISAQDIGDILRLPHDSVDLMIMNPPFQRPTNPEVRTENAPIPSFAGFGNSPGEQRKMSDSLRRINSGLSPRAGHGNAGLASNFIDLTHVKLKSGGILALVLPATALSGGAWEPARALLEREYRDVTIITITATGPGRAAFSADTKIAETLIIAAKRESHPETGVTPTPALYVNLDERPRSIAEAAEIARVVDGLSDGRETGLLTVGADVVARYIHSAVGNGGTGQLREDSLATAALALARGTLRLPRLRDELPVPVVPLGELGQRGLLDRDIYGVNPDGAPRGPFDAIRLRAATPTYPMLCNHHAERERRLLVSPDREGQVRPQREEQAFDVWDTATRLHFTRLFTLRSQSLAACLTRERSLGGQGWPNFRVDGDPRGEEALALWANTTLGLLSFWWEGDRTQPGRARLTISRLPSLLTLDVRQLDPAQLARAKAIFDDFAEREFLPANEAYRDETRQALDRAVLIDLLGLPETVLEPLAVLRGQWCAEPTVHGGKGTRPA